MDGMHSVTSALFYAEAVKNKVMLIALIGRLPAGKGTFAIP